MPLEIKKDKKRTKLVQRGLNLIPEVPKVKRKGKMKFKEAFTNQ